MFSTQHSALSNNNFAGLRLTRSAVFVFSFLLLAGSVIAADPAPFSESSRQFAFANGLLARGFLEEAVQEYGTFLKDYPKDARRGLATLWRGEALFRLEKFGPASRDLYEYLTKYPKGDKKDFARIRYGACLFELGRHAQAVATLQPLADNSKLDNGLRETASYYLGLSHYGQKQYPQALASLGRVKAGALIPDAIYAMAEVEASRKKHLEAAALFAKFIGTYPKHRRAATAGLRHAEELREAGKLGEAAASYQTFLTNLTTEQSARVRAAYGLAWVRYGQGDHAAARLLATQVVEGKVPELHNGARYLHGLACLALNDNQQAVKSFAAVTGGSYLQEAAAKRAWALLSSGKPAEAISAAAECRKRFPKMPAAQLNYIIGKAEAKRKNWPAAIKSLTEVRAGAAMFHFEASYELGLVYDSMGEHQKAADAYKYFAETFPRHERMPDALVGWGRALVNAKKYAAALPVYARLLEKADDLEKDFILRQSSLNQQAVCYYFLKQYANMQKAYQKLLKEDEEYGQKRPEHKSGPSVVEALYWLAWYESSEKRFAKAARLYEQLSQRFPAHPYALKAVYRRTMCLYQDGDEDGAAAVMYAIVTGKSSAMVAKQEILWLGRYLVDHKELKKAYQVYDILLARQPGRRERALALYYQAELKRQEGSWASALAKYERLLVEKETGLEDAAHFGAGVCQRKLGSLEKARQQLAQVKVAPDDPLVVRYHFELGLLDFAEKKYEQALSHLIRVGLLYDDEKLCGEALLKAGEAAVIIKNYRKAMICYQELSGSRPGTYGTRHPKSKFAVEGKKQLAALLKAHPQLARPERME